MRFELFDRCQAQEWLGSDLVPSAEAMTLAERFALRYGAVAPGYERAAVTVGGYR